MLRSHGSLRASGACWTVWVVCIALAVVPSIFGAPRWTFEPTTIAGSQVDVGIAPGPVFKVIGSWLHTVDLGGNVTAVEKTVMDRGQGGMDFPPAIAVGPEGTVHVMTRAQGSFSDNALYYYRIASDGETTNYLVGSPTKRNYVVGAAAVDANNAFMHFTEAGDNVWGNVHVWQDKGSSAQRLGSLKNIWRSDTDARMRGRDGMLYLVSGKCDRNGVAAFTWARMGSSVFSQLQNNLQLHQGGRTRDVRRGFPDLYIDGTGAVHFTYGAQVGDVLYAKYTSSQKKAFSEDKIVLSDLGEWHLSIGLSAVAASDDGNTVVVVGLKTDGSDKAGRCELMWTYSTDCGSSWSPQASLGTFTAGGEGRRRPRIVAIGDTFYLFYYDTAVRRITMGTVSFGTPPKVGVAPRQREARTDLRGTTIPTIPGFTSNGIRQGVTVSGRTMAPRAGTVSLPAPVLAIPISP